MAPNLPSVTEGEPKDPDKFERYEVEGITVYMNRKIMFSRENVTIDIRRYLLTHEIFIEGVDIAY